MTTEAEKAQFLHTVALVLHLIQRGVQCAIHFPLAEAPLVRVTGFAAFETTALADGHYDIWDAGEPPLAPLAAYLSLAETVAFLSEHEGRA